MLIEHEYPAGKWSRCEQSRIHGMFLNTNIGQCKATGNILVNEKFFKFKNGEYRDIIKARDTR